MSLAHLLLVDCVVVAPTIVFVDIAMLFMFFSEIDRDMYTLNFSSQTFKLKKTYFMTMTMLTKTETRNDISNGVSQRIYTL